MYDDCQHDQSRCTVTNHSTIHRTPSPSRWIRWDNERPVSSSTTEIRFSFIVKNEMCGRSFMTVLNLSWDGWILPDKLRQMFVFPLLHWVVLLICPTFFSTFLISNDFSHLKRNTAEGVVSTSVCYTRQWSFLSTADNQNSQQLIVKMKLQI